jgi:predicted phage replisome organizer
MTLSGVNVMSDNKKYYYLKLKDNYFEQDNIIVLESMENGYIYSNIILKLYLKSIRFDGRLMMTERIPYDPKKLHILASALRHDKDHIEKAVKLGVELDLITVMDSGEIFCNDIHNFIGLSSTEADRKREYRLKIKNENVQIEDKRQMSDKCPDNVPNNEDKNPPELEIEKDIKTDKKKELKSYIDSWNDMASKNGLSTVVKFTDSRISKLKKKNKRR